MSRRGSLSPSPAARYAVVIAGVVGVAFLAWWWRVGAPGGLQRSMAAEPRAAFDEESASRRVTLVSLDARSASVGAWSVQDWDGVVTPLAPDLPRTSEGALVLDPGVSRHWLLRPVRLRTEDVVEVAVVAEGWAPEDLVTFCWSREGEAFGADRCVHREVGSEAPGEMRFRLGDLPPWTGDLSAIKVQLTTLADRRITFDRLELIGWRRLADPTVWAGTDWRIEVAGETRSGWVASPGETVRRTIAGARGARLRFAHALSSSAKGKYVLEVALVDGDRAVSSWSTIADASGTDRLAWREATLDLPASAGEALTVELRARPLGEPTGAGFVYWGSLALTRQVRDPRPGRPSVILISIDTLRRDRLSLYGHRRRTSPHLDRWAGERGIVFENVVAAAPWTLPSHVSLLSGMYPFRHGVNLQGPIPRDVPLLAERFRDAGYFTAASTVGPLLTADRGFDRGFDVFRQRGDVLDPADEEAELASGIEWLTRWLANPPPEPFFLFFHTYEPHSAYHPREPFFSRFKAAEGLTVEPASVTADFSHFDPGMQPRFRLIRQPDSEHPIPEVVGPDRSATVELLYDSGVAFTDHHLGSLFDRLRELGLASRAVTAITSDHGESLFEHGLVGHHHLYDDTLMVPLILTMPGRGPRRVAAQVPSVDLAPTLLQAAGLPPPAGIDGESLGPYLDGGEAPGREAWSYSSNTNRGIAWRSPRGLKLWLVDSIFDPVRGELVGFDLRRDPRELAAFTTRGGGVELRNFRAAALAKTAVLPGLYLRLHNQTPSPLEVSLSGIETPTAITASLLEAVSVSYEAGEVSIALPARSSFTVVLQDRSQGQLRIAVGRQGEERFVSAVDLATRKTLGARWQDGTWSRCACDPAGGVGWSVRRVGTPAAPPRGSSESRLREDLRALGYLGDGAR